MSNFKFYYKYKNYDIRYKILYKLGYEDLILELVLSYPNDDIWGDNIFDNCNNNRIYYKKIYLNRDKWAEINNYSDFSNAIEDFNKAIDEFNKYDNWHNFKNKVNIYLINIVNKTIKDLDFK